MIEELKKLAEAATPGPWREDEIVLHKADGSTELIASTVYSGKTRIAEVDDARDQKLIAAANPATVLALIERVERAEAENARMREALEWYAEQAEATARHTLVINPKSVEAIVTCLALDAGNRARAAIEERQS